MEKREFRGWTCMDPILKRLLCDASCFSREDFKEIMPRWWSFERIFFLMQVFLTSVFDLDSIWSGSLLEKRVPFVNVSIGILLLLN